MAIKSVSQLDQRVRSAFSRCATQKRLSYVGTTFAHFPLTHLFLLVYSGPESEYLRDLSNYSVNLASVILFHALHLNDFHRCIKEALEFLYSPPFSVCMNLRLAALLDPVFVSLHASTSRTFLDTSASNPTIYVGCSCPRYFNQLPSKLEISSTPQRREFGYRVLLAARNTRSMSIFSSSI